MYFYKSYTCTGFWLATERSLTLLQKKNAVVVNKQLMCELRIQLDHQKDRGHSLPVQLTLEGHSSLLMHTFSLLQNIRQRLAATAASHYRINRH